MHAGPMGQMVMLTLLLFSLASWSIIFMKTRMFKKAIRETDDFLEAFWSSKTLNDANDAAEAHPLKPGSCSFPGRVFRAPENQQDQEPGGKQYRKRAT